MSPRPTGCVGQLRDRSDARAKEHVLKGCNERLGVVREDAAQDGLAEVDIAGGFPVLRVGGGDAADLGAAKPLSTSGMGEAIIAKLS